MNDFFKDYNKDFFRGFVPLAPLKYDICIIFMDGNKKEVYGIDNPFAYINALKKNPNIKTAYILENN